MTNTSRRIWLYAWTFTALLATVPWFFDSPEQPAIVGFPTWAAYVLVATFFYAVLIAWCLGRYWDLCAGSLPASHARGSRKAPR